MIDIFREVSVERARDRAGGGLTTEELAAYIPDLPYRDTCCKGGPPAGLAAPADLPRRPPTSTADCRARGGEEQAWRCQFSAFTWIHQVPMNLVVRRSVRAAAEFHDVFAQSLCGRLG